MRKQIMLERRRAPGMARSPAVLWILLSLVVPAAGCASRSAAADSVTSPELALGMRVYRQQYCGLCHRFARAGTGGTYGPSHDGYAATAASRLRTGEYAGQATTAADYTRESILNPDAWVVTGYESTRFRMPAYANLTREELEALVRLLLVEEPTR